MPPTWRAVGFCLLLTVPTVVAAATNPAPEIAIDDRAVYEGASGTTTAVFAVALSFAPAGSVTVEFSTSDLTATVADNDYLPASGVLTFLPGETSQPISVTVNGDLGQEASETFHVQLANPSGATLLDSQGLGTILDDDMAPLVCPDLYVTNGEVDALVESGGTLYVGGQFSRVGPMTGSGAVVDSVTGGILGTPPLFDGGLTRSIPDGAGGWFVAGSFQHVGGLARTRLVHLLADGTIAAWDPNPNGSINALLLHNGLLYVGGLFTVIGGEARNGLAALDPATGQATSWNPHPLNGSVSCLAAEGDTIYIGGSFTNIGGFTRNRLAAIDLGTGVPTTWSPSAGNPVNALALDGGTVYVGGSFTTINGIIRSRIAALDAVTGALTTWDPVAGSTVESILVQGGTVYAAGPFHTLGGQTRNFIAALSKATGLATSWNADANSEVKAMALDGSTLYVVGTFTHIGSQYRNYLAALDLAVGTATGWNPDPNGYMYTVAAEDGEVFVGGAMTSIGGVARNGLAALDLATGAVTPWNPGLQPSDAWVLALVTDGSTLYVGGTFSQVGGTGTSNLAAVDLATGFLVWSAPTDILVEALALDSEVLYAGGAFSTINGMQQNALAALDASTGTLLPWNPNISYISIAEVMAIAVQGSTVYFGGYFDEVGGQTRNNIASVDASTAAVTTWDPDADSFVQALAAGGSTVYVGGSFYFIGGQDRRLLAAVDATTGLATPWDPDPCCTSVEELMLLGGFVYAGGGFGTIHGENRRNVAEIDPATGSPTSWNPDPFPGLRVTALAWADGKIYFGGDFTSVAGEPRSGIACMGTSIVTGVHDQEQPEGFHLTLGSIQGGRGVQIDYELPRTEPVHLDLFDVQGRRVAALVDGVEPAGQHQITWNGRGDQGHVASGVYFAQLRTSSRRDARRFVLLH